MLSLGDISALLADINIPGSVFTHVVIVSAILLNMYSRSGTRLVSIEVQAPLPAICGCQRVNCWAIREEDIYELLQHI